jgi:hypothetical protein
MLSSAAQTDVPEIVFNEHPLRAQGQSSALSASGADIPRKPLAIAQVTETLRVATGGAFDPAAVSKANRAITRKELLPRRFEIMREREFLFEMSLERDLTPGEATRLRYLEWQLDRIEDADIGENLDQLSLLADLQAEFGERVEKWVDDVRKIMPSPSKHKGRAKRRR